MKTIEQLEERLAFEVARIPVDKKTLTKLLIQRNKIMWPDYQLSNDSNSQYQNTCELMTGDTQIPREFIAYHTGPANQVQLVNNETSFENLRLTNHVYFSMNLGETVDSYLLPKHYKNRVVYATDLRQAKGARVLTSYDKGLWNWEISTLISCYNDPDFLKSLCETEFANSPVARPFRHQPREKLRQEIIKKINNWLPTFTIPFRLKHLDRYRKRHWTYILIPQPIKVR